MSTDADVKPGAGGPTLVEEAHAFGMETTKILIEKGFTPHTSSGPFGQTSWWDDQRVKPDLRPVVTVIGMILLFVLCLIYGVPWS